MNKYISTVIIAPLTSQSHAYPTRMPVKFKRKDGWIVLDQIRMVAKQRLVKKLGVIGQDTILTVKNVIREMLIEPWQLCVFAAHGFFVVTAQKNKDIVAINGRYTEVKSVEPINHTSILRETKQGLGTLHYDSLPYRVKYRHHERHSQWHCFLHCHYISINNSAYLPPYNFLKSIYRLAVPTLIHKLSWFSLSVWYW